MNARQVAATVVIVLALLLCWRWSTVGFGSGAGTTVSAASDEARIDAKDARSAATDTPRDNESRERARVSGPKVAFSARLVRDGHPLAGVRVFEVFTVQRNRRGKPEIRRREIAASDSNGRFAISRPAGLVRLTFQGPRVEAGYIAAVRVIPGQQRALELEIPRPRRIHGRTVDEDEAALGDVRITFASPGNPWSSRTTRSGVDGRFELLVMNKRGKLSFEHDRFCPDTRGTTGGFDAPSVWTRLDNTEQQTEPIGGLDEDVGRIVMRARRSLSGVVVNRRGRPLGGALVSPTYYAAKDSVPCDARGAFEITTQKAYGHEVYVSAPGYVRRKLSPTSIDQALRIELHRAAELECEVVWSDGLRPTQLDWEVDSGSGGWDAAFDLMSDLEQRGRSVMVDPGRYEFVARAGTTGVSRPVRVTLRAGESKRVRVRIEPHPRLELVVVDESGTPVRDALCTADIQNIERTGALSGVSFPDARTRSGDLGRAELAIPAGHPAVIQVAHGEYEDWTGRAHPGQSKARVVLRRAGRLRGSVPQRLLALWAPRVRLQKVVDPSEKTLRRLADKWLAVDAHGRFEASSLPAGQYELTLDYDTPQQTAQRQAVLLGDGTDPRTRWRVRVSAGNVAVVDFDPPPLSRVRGRVLRHGRPVAHAYVEAWIDTSVQGSRLRKKGQAIPRTTTERASDASCWADRHGYFEFYFATENCWRLSATARSALLSGPATHVRLTHRTPITEVTLDIGEAQIRGQLDLASLESAQREDAPAKASHKLSAYLFTKGQAKSDAFSFDANAWMPMLSLAMASVRLTEDGSFVIKDVPEGTWLLRIANFMGPVLSRVLVVERGQVVELGKIRPEPKHEVELELVAKTGSWNAEVVDLLRQHVSFPDGIYAGWARPRTRADSPSLAHLKIKLAAGSYVIQAGEGTDKQPAPTARVRIDQKGKATPSRLVF